ncbi:MAG: tetratricopeptide repeat protein [Planctomycetaceae bacterium]
MNPRILVPLAVLFVLGAPAGADVVFLKNGKVLGLPDSVKEENDTVLINLENFRRYLPESKGDIVTDGYSGIEFQRSPSAKKESVPRDQIADYDFLGRPDALDDGINQMQAGNFAQAIGTLREVTQDEKVREVFKIEAEFRVGLCLVQSGNLPGAVRHFGGWKYAASVYTPQIHSIVAQIHRQGREFAKAREAYSAMEKLPDLPAPLLHAARLGQVDVDIAERKFDVAEASLRQISSRMGGDPALADPRAQAQVLLARLLLESQNKERYAEARTGLEAALDYRGLSAPTAAAVYASLGDIIYAMGDPEAARFAYMRVVCMYPDEGGLVAHALRNAGQCFLDLALRAEKTDMAASDEFLKQGVPLLQECMGKFRATASAKEAASAFAKVKDRYEKLTAK